MSKERRRILVVDDEPRGAELLARGLRKAGLVETATSGEEARKRLEREAVDLVVTDQRMPGMTGVELLSYVARHSPRTGRILITAYADIAATIAAINEGRVHAYLSKPCAPAELRATAESVLDWVKRDRQPPEAMLGVSPAIREVMERVAQVASTNIPVLILGETGVGKELVAHALHDRSAHRAGRFVAVNCAALPEALLESELFGFRRGAFTGADRDKRGLFEAADGGTLFLDEIGDTTPALQVKLLRTLESGEIRPLGSHESRPVDVRLVSATHRDLETLVKEEIFRQDLYYRINTVVVEVPPLRARREDIPILARHFAETFARANGRRAELSDAFLDALSRLELPGNVRELRNRVERAVALSGPEGRVEPSHLDRPGTAPDTPARQGDETLRALVDRVETEAIQDALRRTGGNRTQAARELGLSRYGLRKKMTRLGLEEGPDR